MANNVINRVWNQNRMVTIEDLKGMAFQAESGGHTFQISGIDDAGNIIALSGSVAGVFLRPDNTDVAITGSASGGVVSVTLPANCYDVPGRFGLTIFVTANGQKTAVYAAMGTVSRTSSGTVSPGTTSNVVDLINQINAAVATIPASWTGLMADIAPTYSDTAVYPVGAYVYYNGDLYRCTTAITTAESWTAEHWTAAVLGNDVSDLNEKINVVFDGGYRAYDAVIPTVNVGKAINNLGAEIETSGYNDTGYVSLPDGVGKVSLYATFASNLGMAFYSASGTVLLAICGNNVAQYGGTNKSEPQTLLLDAPEGTKYIRATVRDYYYTSPSMFNIIPYVRYGSAYELINDVDENIKNIADYKTSKNLCDNDNLTVGAVTSNGSITTEGAWANYITSDFIGINPGENYVISSFVKTSLNVTNGRKAYVLYDANKGVISNTFVNQSGVYQLTFNNANAYYVRVSTSNDSYLQVEQGTEHTGYEPYDRSYALNDGFGLTDTMREEVSDLTSNILNGKKWAHCGDSFSDYTNMNFTSGIYSGKNKTYPRIIAERNGMNLLQDFMLSGRTIAYPADGTFVNSLTAPGKTYNYQNIPNDVDYVTIMLGINDSQHTGSGSTGDGEDATGVITLGTIDDTDTSTYYGAYNTVLAWLRENRPFAHVGIVVSNGIEQQAWVEAQIAVAKKWGYPLINLNGDERTAAFIRCYNPNIPASLKASLKTIQGVDAPSNTHPNWQTHELESTIIESWLRTL